MQQTPFYEAPVRRGIALCECVRLWRLVLLSKMSKFEQSANTKKNFEHGKPATETQEMLVMVYGDEAVT